MLDDLIKKRYNFNIIYNGVIFPGGPKLLYLNMKIRGYPKGIRAGLDPRKPSLEINEAFTVMTYKGIPYQLQSVEVWGCGTPQSR